MLVELARETANGWDGARKMVTYDEAVAIAAKDPDSAWYTSTFKLHGPLSQKRDEDFERLPKSGDLVFDFDCTDTERARQDCARVKRHLVDSLLLDPGAIRTYSSGSKGFHLVVSWDALDLDPAHDLHSTYRAFATGLANSEIVPNKTLDTKVYNARRMWRLPNSINLKSGKRKTLIDIETGNEIADTPSTATVCKPLHDALMALRDASTDKAYTQRNRLPQEYLSEPLDCVQYVLLHGLPEGMRNEGAYTTALYFRSCGLTKEETKQRLVDSALHRLSGVPLTEIKTTITSAFNSDHKFGLRDNVLEPFITQRDRERWRASKLDEDYERLSEVAYGVLDQLKHNQLQIAKYYVGSIDRLWGGLNAGELVVLGGTTGTGKSEFAFHVARSNALAGVPTAFVSLELPNRDLVRRVVGSAAGIDASAFWTGQLSEGDKASISKAIEELIAKDPPLFFRRKKNMMSVEELETMIQRLILEQQVKLLVIDHLHYFSGREHNEKENLHVARTIRAINTMTIKHNIATVCIAHFKKVPNNQYKPSHHEFRDSSAIEQEAATIITMWRDLDAVLASQQAITEFKLAKSRKDLALATIKTRFNKQTRAYDEIVSH